MTWLRVRSGTSSGEKYRRLDGRTEGAGHQPSAILNQPGKVRGASAAAAAGGNAGGVAMAAIAA